MVLSQYEVLELIYHYPKLTSDQIYNLLLEFPFPKLLYEEVNSCLSSLYKNKYLVREKTGKSFKKKKDGTERKNKVYVYSLSDKALRIRKKYGSFFNSPFALYIKSSCSRDWAPKGKFFFDIISGKFV